jgi:hypothetical protein
MMAVYCKLECVDVAGRCAVVVAGLCTLDVAGLYTVDVAELYTVYVAGLCTVHVAGLSTADVAGLYTVDVAGLCNATTGRSAVWGCGRLLAEIVVSNPSEARISDYCECCQVEVSKTG